MAKEKLINCRYCDNKPTIKEDKDKMFPKSTYYEVLCLKCGSMGWMYLEKQQAIDTWNRINDKNTRLLNG